MTVRLALIGWGAIGHTVAPLLADAPVDLVAVGVRSRGERNDLPPGTALLTDPSELAATRPDVVAEAAGRDAVAPWGRAALTVGADFIVSSVSAFTDETLLDDLRSVAASGGTRLQIQTGALAGVDALASARPMGIDSVEHRIVKPPAAWRGTPAEAHCDLDALDTAVTFFRGSAREAARDFPKNANVAMTSALAGIGPDATRISLVADPAATTNRHELEAHGGFGHLATTIANQPLPTNPKTSALAALSLVRAIRNRADTIVI